ncbi:MAG: hypothetical protein IJ849_12820 [Selenomonadaceae bacterium]|nr:hypothetical protein [Selenomonadaceae bacterium]
MPKRPWRVEFSLPQFTTVAMDEYIERHPLKASVPLADVLALCNIDEAELSNVEGIELE